MDDAWHLAEDVYASAALRPAALDEASAQVLAGETPEAGAPKAVVDLGRLRAAVQGDDPASVAVLKDIGERLGVGYILVVARKSGEPTARLFRVRDGRFDAARYAPDEDGKGRWSGTVASLEFSAADRSLDTDPPAESCAAAAPSVNAARLRAIREEQKGNSTPFYASPWFWGAVGAGVAAAIIAGVASQNSSPDSVHLRLRVAP